MDRKWAFYIWYSKTRRTGDGRMCQTVSMRQLEWWIQRNMPMYLIDVRDRESYEKGHLQGAVSVPLEELETQMGTFPRDRMIVCCCQRGSSSLMACRKLSEAGSGPWSSGGLMAYGEVIFWLKMPVWYSAGSRFCLGFSLTDVGLWT